MKLIAYLMFRGGKCREAFGFYAQALRGEILSTTAYGDLPPMPGAPPMPDAMKPLIANIHLRAGDADLMGADGVENPDGQATTSVNIDVETTEEAERVFAAMSVGGQVRMPLMETAWSLRFGMFDDRYGQPWMVNCMRPKT
jgi:PhnB protein